MNGRHATAHYTCCDDRANLFSSVCCDDKKLQRKLAITELGLQVSKQLSASAAVLKAGPPPVVLPATLTAADLDKPVSSRLEEPATIWLLNLPGGCINADTEEGKAVETANNKSVPDKAQCYCLP